MLHLQANMDGNTEVEACREMLRSLDQTAHLRVLSLAWAMQVRSHAMRNRYPGMVCAVAAWQGCSWVLACWGERACLA